MKGKCKWCSLEFNLANKQKGWMANHSRWCDKNPNRKKYEEHLAKLRANWKSSEITLKKRGDGIHKAHLRGAYDSAHEQKRGKPGCIHTEKTKQIMSEKALK